MAVGFDVCVLQHIFGIGVVPDDGARDTKELAVVAPHQRFERPLVAGRDPLNEDRVGYLVRRNNMGCWDRGFHEASAI